MKNYEKEYKEALEKIREGLHPLPDGTKISGVTRAFLEEVFPELKESEEERIRKMIINHLTQERGSLSNDEAAEAIAWLEKQGKRDARYENLEELLDADTIYQMAMNDAMVEGAKTKAMNALSELEIGKLLGIEKQGKKKPTWSDEDDKTYYSLLADIRARQDSSTSTLEAYYNEQINWLKSLKERLS